MTNEEAIEVLKNDIEICTIKQEQACDMAIKALEHTCVTCKWNKNRPLGNCINCMRSYYDCWEEVSNEKK